MRRVGPSIRWRWCLISIAMLRAACATAPPVAETPALTSAAPPAASSKPDGSTVRPLQKPTSMQTVFLPDPDQPIVSLRLVFQSGSVDDPAGKEGLTALTATLMEEGGTQALSASQLLEALYPIAGETEVETDKEFTTFAGRIHKDQLDKFFKIFTDLLLEPRFDPKEFERLKTDALSSIRNRLRGQDDERLGKVALDALLYADHPYRHFDGGTVNGVTQITLDDVKEHAKKVFSQDRLVVGLAGPVDRSIEAKLIERLSALPKTGAARANLPTPGGRQGRAWILEKGAISTAISFGYSYDLRRDDPDFYAMALALSYLGEHRQSHGLLFEELRAKRGLNYGDYAYPEHFDQEGFSTLARTNIARSRQDFSIWIRPVEPANAIFATRAALYFLDRLIREGIPPDKFEVARGFLRGYTLLWEQTDERRLGCAIDNLFYGTPNFLQRFRQALESLTPAQVHDAVRRHLSLERLNFVFVAKSGKELAQMLASGAPAKIQYPTPKPSEILEVDKSIAVQGLPIDAGAIQIIDAQQFMER